MPTADALPLADARTVLDAERAIPLAATGLVTLARRLLECRHPDAIHAARLVAKAARLLASAARGLDRLAWDADRAVAAAEPLDFPL